MAEKFDQISVTWYNLTSGRHRRKGARRRPPAPAAAARRDAILPTVSEMDHDGWLVLPKNGSLTIAIRPTTNSKKNDHHHTQ